MNNNKVLLAILDGFGIGDKSRSDAISASKTPNFTTLLNNYPHNRLFTHGEYVGLPNGQMGNSEVGHSNIGAGRVLYQDLVRINKDLHNNIIKDNPILKKAISYALNQKKPIHLIGLVSDGGVHSMNTHLYGLINIFKEFPKLNVNIHCITDGRDTDPKSGINFIKQLYEGYCSGNIQIASIIGRYYAMDRDKRWERVQLAYDLLVNSVGERESNPINAIHNSYSHGITDEFIRPILMDPNISGFTGIHEGDVVLCFNFRTDRLRELTYVLTQNDMTDFKMKKMSLYYLTMTNYDESFVNIQVIYDKEKITNTLGEIVSLNNLRQLRIAETEKYAHVTYFFSGGRELPFVGEDRVLIESPKIPTYDLKPEMSAYIITDKLIELLRSENYSLIVLNFANCDMVGHTGIYSAIVKAVEAVDRCLGKVVEVAVQNDYTILITADHGNADYAINEDGSANTEHSLNPVPFIVVNSTQNVTVKEGKLADIAPTILHLLGIGIPNEMNGEVLIEDDGCNVSMS